MIDIYTAPHMDFSIICDIHHMSKKDITAELIISARNAVDYGMYHIFYDDIGLPVGYMIWANVTKETLNYSLSHNTKLQYAYEYDEGRLSFIQHLFLPLGIRYSVVELKSLIKSQRLWIYRRKEKITTILNGIKINKKQAATWKVP